MAEVEGSSPSAPISDSNLKGAWGKIFPTLFKVTERSDSDERQRGEALMGTVRGVDEDDRFESFCAHHFSRIL